MAGFVVLDMSQEDYDKRIRNKAIDELTQQFKIEFTQMMELEIEDCINWADWIEKTAEQMKGGE